MFEVLGSPRMKKVEIIMFRKATNKSEEMKEVCMMTNVL